MKLLHVDIENFGLFSAQSFELNSAGFQLVVGPNEAGKSTLLQLIRELLFGFQVRNPYSFDEHTGEMAATALIELSDGSRVRFRRRKGTKNVVKGEFEETAQEVDETRLWQMLDGATPELYQHVFGFSLAELTTGEKSLAHANLNEALYGGGIGGLAGFQKHQTELQDEASNLFAPAASKRTINRLLAEIKTLGRETRDATVKPRDYDKLVKSCDEQKQVADALRESLDSLRSRERHLQRLADAIPPWLELVQSEDELQSLSVPNDFPLDGAAQFKDLRQQREQLTRNLAEYNKERLEVEDQLTGVELNPKLLEHEAEIRKLAQRLSEIEGFRRDFPLREQESATKKRDVKSQLRELNPEWDLPQLEEFRAGLAQRDAVARSQQESDELDNRRRELTNNRRNLGRDIGQLSEQVDKLTSSAPSVELEQLAAQSVHYENELQKLAELHEQLCGQDAEIASLCEQLSGPLGIALDADAVLPLPLESTVVEFRERLEQTTQKAAQARQQVQQVRAVLQQARDDLAQLDAEATVPDREQLLVRRMHRDEGWKLIRRRFIETEEVSQEEVSVWLDGDDSDLPNQYEQEVVAADRLADQRQEKSEAAAKRDQLMVTIDRLEKRLETSEHATAETEEAVGQVDQAWRALWSSCPFEPLSPAAMIDWLRQYDSLRKVRDAARLSAEKSQQLQQNIGAFEGKLRKALNDAKSDPQILLNRLKQRVEADRKASSRRETFQEQIADKQQISEQLKTSILELDSAASDWQQRWTTVLEQFGFPREWDVHLATMILNGLSAARSEYENAESLDQRVGEMRDGLRTFEEQVNRLCSGVAVDLTKLPAEDAVVALNNRLDRAKQAARDHQKLISDKEKNDRKITARQFQLDNIKCNIQQLLTAARAESEPQFLEIAERAARHAELSNAIDNANKQIRILRGTEGEEAFHEALKTADVDLVSARRRELLEQIQEADATYEAAREAYTLRKNELEKLDGESRAAELSADVESSRSQLAVAVDRWAPLVLAQTVMRRAIQRFEREHQPAMLQEVERLFSRMTAGRYTAIHRKLDEQGTLRVIEHTGQRKEPHELSTGTREQLYLAIRLAYINHYCRDAEPLPVVMDDVLVNFDPPRLQQTIHVLRDIAESIQVVFLTCHDHMVDVVSEAIPDCAPVYLANDVNPSTQIASAVAHAR